MADDPRRGHKIGVLVPYTNVNLEPDMIKMCPKGCTMHFERLGDYDIDAIPGPDQMAGLGTADMSETLRLIAGIRPSAILYGCTSATLTQGVAFDRDLAAKIEDRSGAVSLTAAGSLLRAIQVLGITKVGFASPYVGDIIDRAVSFLADEGIETVKQADIGRALGNYEQGELTPAEVFDLAIRADGPAVEAILLSCTDMRAVEAIEAIETTIGKPVITSNQAMIFALCRELNLPQPSGAPGRLFERL